MSYSANLHIAVYQVLDNVIGARAAPPGAKAEIHSIIDVMRSLPAAREFVTLAEAISLRLHQLELSLIHDDVDLELDARRGPEGYCCRVA